MKVRFTASARNQFLDAIAFIKRDKPEAARRYRRRAETALRRLARLPSSGRRIPEYPELPFRELIVESHRYFYRVEGTTLWIVAVWHGAQEPAPPPSGFAHVTQFTRRT